MPKVLLERPVPEFKAQTPVNIETVLSNLELGTGAPIFDLSNTTLDVAQLNMIAAQAAASGFYDGLNLTNCSLTPAHIDVLKNRFFTSMIFSQNPNLGADGANRIAGLNLTYVVLNQCNSIGGLGSYQYGPLRSFIARQNTINQADVAALSRNNNLSEIDLSGDGLHVDDATCLMLAKNLNLTWVDLRGCALLSDNTVGVFARNPNLRYVDFSNCRNLSVTGMQNIALIPNLNYLTLIGINETSTAPAASKNLIGINLSFNTLLGDAGFAVYANTCPNLQTLTLQACSLTDASVKLMMQKLPNLIYADVTFNGVSSEMMQELQTFTQNNQARIRQFGLTVPVEPAKPAVASTSFLSSLWGKKAPAVQPVPVAATSTPAAKLG